MKPQDPKGLGKILRHFYFKISTIVESVLKITTGVKYVIGATSIAGVTGAGILVTVPGPIDAQELVDNGYHETQRTSPIPSPGVFTIVEERDDGTLNLYLACKTDINALREQWVDSKVNLKRKPGKRKFVWTTLEPEDQSVRTFDQINARHVTLSDEELLTLSNQYLKGTCIEAIKHNLDNGARICQVRSVIGFAEPSSDDADSPKLLVSESSGERNSDRNDDQAFLFVKLRERCITKPNTGTEEVLAPAPKVNQKQSSQLI